MDRMKSEAEASGAALTTKTIPFDADRLDRLMEEAGLDVLVVTSKHNIQYLLGGYRFFFFDAMDAIGVSRYLPVLVYAKGRSREAAYIGNPMESYERDRGSFWMDKVEPVSWGTADAAEAAASEVRRLVGKPRHIG